MDTTILEDEIRKYQTIIEDREKHISFLKRQQKVDKDILKMMEKGLKELKPDNNK
jgi:hypothetical protein